MAEIEKMLEKERVEEFHENLLKTADKPPEPQFTLINYEETMSFKHPQEYSKYHQAVREGDMEIVKSLVPSVFPVDCILQATGWGLLQQVVTETTAPEGMLPEVTQYLLDLGADPNFVVQAMGLTTLDLCCQNLSNTQRKSDTLEMIKLLVKAGADVNHCSGALGLPCIYWSVLNTTWSPELSDLMLSLGTNLEVVNCNKGTLFHNFFITLERVDYKTYPDEDVVMHMLTSWGQAHPKGLFAPDAFGNTPLHYAVRNGAYVKSLKYLLERGADPNITNSGGETPYDWALLPGGGDDRQKIAAYLSPFRAPSLPGHSKLPLEALSFSTWKQIGMGSFGRVYKARYEAIREDVAVKELKNGESIHYRLQRAEFQHEIAELHASRCNFVLTYFGFAVNEETKTLYMVTELCSNSLDKILSKEGSPPLSRLLSIVSQVGKALLYLHTGDRCHNDVAARNILLARDGDTRLGDFGLACRVGDPLPRIAILWAPPEALTTSSHSRKAHYSYDVWSFGVLVWEIFESARTPYCYIEGGNKELRDHIISGGILKKPDKCPERFWNDIIMKCFTVRELRPTMEELLEIIESYQRCVEEGVEDDLSDCTSLSAEERLRRALDRERAWVVKQGSQSGSTFSSNTLPAHNLWAYKYYIPSDDNNDPQGYFGYEYGDSDDTNKPPVESYYDYEGSDTIK